MRFLFSLLLCFVASASVTSLATADQNRLTPEQIAAGWISLFDGETLFGWQQVNKVDWQVTSGEIRATQGDVGFLMTTSSFSDYELQLDFRAGSDTNSGVFLHTQENPGQVSKDCYEVNIAPPSNPFPTGSIVRRQRAGSSRVKPLNPWDGQWHTYHLKLQGNTLTVRLDGKLLIEYVDPQPCPRGHISLQHNQGEIAFRNVRLKPLRTKSIFNGKDLTGWNTDRAETSEFRVTSGGELQVLNGRGQLESDAVYGDFLMQLECFVNGDALNSGLFFRCIPGDFMMGYECQIHNGMQAGDPAQPQDCGTGGFFRRQNARRIVAKDREWFALTLIADGPQMAAWVDGQQVSDWIDTRTLNENPRKGLRTEAGTLAIQGRDPTTDLRFRKLRAKELPAAAD